MSILRSLTAAPEAMGVVTDEGTWQKIALLHISDATLDSRSIGLIRRQTQKSFQADGIRRNADRTLTKLVDKLQLNIAPGHGAQ